MPQTSAGIILYRHPGAALEVLLIHPGGPFWARKDEAAWSIPKGLTERGEALEMAARREFSEETGMSVTAALAPLGSFKQPSGKVLTAFAAEGEFDPTQLRSNTFEMEWPPGTGRVVDFPEADRAGWFTLLEAERKLVKGQLPILTALRTHLATAG